MTHHSHPDQWPAPLQRPEPAPTEIRPHPADAAAAIEQALPDRRRRAGSSDHAQLLRRDGPHRGAFAMNARTTQRLTVAAASAALAMALAFAQRVFG